MKHLSGEAHEIVTLRIEFPHNEDHTPIAGKARLGDIDHALERGYLDAVMIFQVEEHHRIWRDYKDYKAEWFILSDGRDDDGAVVLEAVEDSVIDAGREKTVRCTFDPTYGPNDLTLTLRYSKYLLARDLGAVLIDVPKAVEGAHVGFWAILGVSYGIKVEGIDGTKDEEVWMLMRPERHKALLEGREHDA
ncbi:hypothetical protein HOU02_gp063 [Caulobacter phage CcrBL9]|uniref:Uncharacterized protein n=1 Tax=Caulobacter phage CcrBL9 TaxID=2283270 RepID=A0A385EE37_9CAUD|nr:hypothetical protein HOU02_gp063 [Caulobacter phage CcrBL9]AXQ69087.1 hypothetical protein CcrBL9_gp063c [Caulobacter phage CcrBL9]